MKSLFIICLFSMICYTLNSQTEDIEKENLNKKIQNGQLPAGKSKKLGDDWRKLIKDMKGYPRLPFDTVNNIVRFQYNIKADDSKKGIYSKIQEWSSLNFGQITKILRYGDYETGRMFIDGYFNIRLKPDYIENNYRLRKGIAKKTCYFTLMFTIKEGKFKMEASKISFEYYFPEYYTETSFVPEKSIEIDLHSLYPVSNHPSEAWKENLELMLVAKNEFYKYAISLKDYIDTLNRENNF